VIEPSDSPASSEAPNWRQFFTLREDSVEPSSLSGLAFLASGIAGRQLKIYLLAPAEPSYTDGQTIFLNPELSTTQRTAVAAAHAALIDAGSLDSQCIRAISLRPAVAARFFSMELPRAVRGCESLLPEALVTSLPLPENICGSVEESLARAKDHRHKVKPTESWLGVLRPRRMLKGAGPGSANAVAGKLDSFRINQLEEHDEDEDLDTSSAKVMKLFSSPLASANWLTDMLQQILGMGRGGAGEEENDGSGGAHGGGSAHQASGENLEITDSSLQMNGMDERLPLLPQQTDWKYPVWHVGKGRYLPDWVNVNEIEAPAETDQRLEPCDVSMHTLAQQLFKVGVEFENHRRQPTGDDIDVDALVEHLVDRATGHTHEENIYCNSQRTRRDLSAAMLVDISRSTSDRLADGKTIFGQQVHAARLISRALSYFGDRVAVYAFHSWGRGITRLLRIKGFDEAEGALIDGRFTGLQPSGLTRLGAAIRHASFRLQQEKYHTHRLLMVFTDGFAYDDEYEGRYAEADVAKALSEARERGVACVCISIGSEQRDDNLERTFGTSTYLHCQKVRDLPARLQRLINTALRITEKSR
jgi:nitric oxide reductase NorD protein